MMRRDEFGWDATFGVKRDGTKEVLVFGNMGYYKNALNHYDCTAIYHRTPEEMTDEEFNIAVAAYQDFIERMMKWAQ